MKISNYIFVLIIGFMLSSACTSSKSDSAALLPELATAESIMYEHPDSALHILESMPMPNTTDKFQHATWALLMTQARYKNYVEQSDTLINMAYDYFMNREDAQRRAMVLYYKGAVCEDNNQIEKALNYYVEATKEVGQIEDYQLAHLIYAEIGDIYVFRSSGNFAVETFEKALYYAIKSQNKHYICFSYLYLGKAYSLLGNWNKAIEQYENAITEGEKAADSKLLVQAMNELAGIYTDIQNYNLALSYAQKSIELKKKINSKDMEQSFLVLGDLYRNVNKTDSAYYYLNRALSANSIYTLRSTYQALFYLSQKEKQYEKMIEFCDKYWVYQDSIHSMEKIRELAEMQVKYNQQKLINEKNLLQIEKDSVIREALIGLVMLLCIIAILIYFYQRKVILKERIIQQNEEELRKNVLQMQENEATIERNNERLKELSAQIAESQDIQEQMEEQHKAMEEIQRQNERLKQENESLQKNVDSYASSLNEKGGELSRLDVLSKDNRQLRSRETFLSNQLIRKTPVLHQAKSTPKYITDAQWEEIKEAVNHLFDNYTMRLQHVVPSLTESDLQVCCLIKLRMPNPDIATSLGISSTSVSKRKLRLKERILQSVGSLGESHTLDLWLWEF